LLFKTESWYFSMSLNFINLSLFPIFSLIICAFSVSRLDKITNSFYTGDIP
jgi:hypothetical protein